MSADRSTDTQLVERAQRSDARAFDLLMLKYQHKIHSLVGRYVREPEEVQDVAQEAFVKAYKALPRFRGDSQFYTWLYRIAINTAKNHLVSRGRRPRDAEVDPEEAEAQEGGGALRELENPENQLAGEDLKRVIFEAIDALPEDLRTALTLREFEALSYEEISNVMECPVGTVRSRIFRAREAIDQRIRPLLER